LFLTATQASVSTDGAGTTAKDAAGVSSAVSNNGAARATASLVWDTDDEGPGAYGTQGTSPDGDSPNDDTQETQLFAKDMSNLGTSSP
jgi:hypothetical protein